MGKLIKKLAFGDGVSILHGKAKHLLCDLLGVTCHWAAKLISIFIRYVDFGWCLKISVFSIWLKSCPSLVSTEMSLSAPLLGNRVTDYRVRTPHLKYLGAYETFSFVTCQATQVAQREELMTSKLVVKTQKLVCKILSCNYARVLLQKDSITPEFWENFLKSFWKFSSYPWMSWKFTGMWHLNYFVACIFSTIISKCF